MGIVSARPRAFSFRSLLSDRDSILRAEYERFATDDFRAFKHLCAITAAERASIEDRVVAAILRVAACSAPYAVSKNILDSAFTRALAMASLAIVIFGLLRTPSAPLQLVITIAAGLLGVFVFAKASLRIRLGWRFDVAWYIAWAIPLWLLRPSQFPPTQWIWATEAIVLGIGLYSLLIVISISVAGIVYIRTTTLKKHYPEEEIIETLLSLMYLVEQSKVAWSTESFRAQVATNLDWIADRFEFDFFRSYASRDTLTTTWATTAATNMAGYVRTLKQIALLPYAASVSILLGTLSTMFVNVARGDWAAVPRLQNAAPAANRRDLMAKGVQIVLSIAIPLAAAAIVQWTFTLWRVAEAVKTPVLVALFSSAIASLLAAIKPSGFDKQVSGAKG